MANRKCVTSAFAVAVLTAGLGISFLPAVSTANAVVAEEAVSTESKVNQVEKSSDFLATDSLDADGMDDTQIPAVDEVPDGLEGGSKAEATENPELRAINESDSNTANEDESQSEEGVFAAVESLPSAPEDEPVPMRGTEVPSETVFTVADTGEPLAAQLARAEQQGATTVRVAVNVTDGGEAPVPACVTYMAGWQEASFFDPEGVKARDLGYVSALTVEFPAGMNAKVESINFARANKADAQGATAVVEAGASVHFLNCSFANTPVVNGSAVFENCTFATSKVENNGTASYTGTTERPEEVGTPQPSYVPLTLSLGGQPPTVAAVRGQELSLEVPFDLQGTLAGEALVEASVDPEGSGVTAEVRDGKLVLGGTPASAGSIRVTLTATAQRPGEEPDSASVSLEVQVQEPITVVLEGQLQAFTSVTGKSEDDYPVTMTRFAADDDDLPGADMVDAVSSASLPSGGSSTPGDQLKLKVAEGRWRAGWNRGVHAAAS